MNDVQRDAAVSFGQNVDSQCQQHAYSRRRQGRSDSAAMRSYQIDLKLDDFLARYTNAGEIAETGRYTVNDWKIEKRKAFTFFDLWFFWFWFSRVSDRKEAAREGHHVGYSSNFLTSRLKAHIWQKTILLYRTFVLIDDIVQERTSFPDTIFRVFR